LSRRRTPNSTPKIGFKLIARELGITYTVCRRLLIKILKIDTRKGTSVVTEKLKKFRKQKAVDEIKNNQGFASYQARKNNRSNKISRGIGGYYWNKTFNKYVWLRSSWEYIYAKWLDSKNIKWDVEVKYYFFDGGKYLPDFFIYNDKLDTIKTIVEIKGGYSKWDREHYKKIKEVEIVVIKNIKQFINEDSSELKERKKWKSIRKTEI
jgi:hypothetical protein